MGNFQIGTSENEQRGHIEVTGFVSGGAIAVGALYGGQPGDQMGPVQQDVVEHLGHNVVLMLDYSMWCHCTEEGCPGLQAPVTAEALLGWEPAAALMGQLDAWFDSLPVDVRDQAAALRRHQADEMAKARVFPTVAEPAPEPWHPYEQSDPAVPGCDHCGGDRRLHP